MLRCFILIVILFLSKIASSQQHWQQQTNYTIDVTLNDSLKLLTGQLKLEYINHSPDTLQFIWMHIWQNAFSSDLTAFSKQKIRNGESNFYFLDSTKLGYVKGLDFKQDHYNVHFEYHPEHIDIIKVYLQEPLLPNQSTIIQTPFEIKLPYNVSRGGFNQNTFQVTQWYPKAAMYDSNGWHLYPYLDIGEYYNNFGNYDVTLHVPKNFVVAATGMLQNVEEKNWLKQKKEYSKENPAKTNLKTLHYTQNQITDFAWFADEQYQVDFDTIQLNGKTIEAWTFYRPQNQENWSKAIDIIKSTIRFKSEVLGEYPYPIVSVVQSALGFSGGMEYPTITNISTTNDYAELVKLIKHEVGHNWFQAILASDERSFPWLDEGLNSYYDNRFIEKFLNENDPQEDMVYKSIVKAKWDQPINTPSPDFSSLNFSLFAYTKAAQWLKMIEENLGQKTFDSIMKTYYQDWKFKHPNPNDFKKYFDSIPNFDSDYYFSLLDQTGYLKPPSHNKFKTAFFYKKNEDNEQLLLWNPITGFNHYDKLMLGAVIHNYQLPNPNLNFLIAPLYSFSNQKMNGLARVSYTFRGNHYGEKWLLSVDGNLFSNRRGVDSNLNKISSQYYKIAPALRYVFPEKTAYSRNKKYLEFKSFWIGEKAFSYQETLSGEFFPALTTWNKRYVNRLTFQKDNNHVINPTNLTLQVMQGKEFVRMQATFQGKFNYADKGYFGYRITFAGFNYLGGYTTQKYINTRGFQPKLTANRGWEDLTYSQYYFGRNETEGVWSRQIDDRDGFLKLRTDVFSELQGRSDVWIAAMNVSTSLPKKIFPWRAVRLFLDIGTYSETWSSVSVQPNLLYVGGFQINVFKDVLEVYVPVIYSKLFRDNLKTLSQTKSIGKNISFLLNLSKLNFSKTLEIPTVL